MNEDIASQNNAQEAREELEIVSEQLRLALLFIEKIAADTWYSEEAADKAVEVLLAIDGVR